MKTLGVNRDSAFEPRASRCCRSFTNPNQDFAQFKAENEHSGAGYGDACGMQVGKVLNPDLPKTLVFKTSFSVTSKLIN